MTRTAADDDFDIGTTAGNISFWGLRSSVVVRKEKLERSASAVHGNDNTDELCHSKVDCAAKFRSSTISSAGEHVADPAVDVLCERVKQMRSDLAIGLFSTDKEDALLDDLELILKNLKDRRVANLRSGGGGNSFREGSQASASPSGPAPSSPEFGTRAPRLWREQLHQYEPLRRDRSGFAHRACSPYTPQSSSSGSHVHGEGWSVPDSTSEKSSSGARGGRSPRTGSFLPDPNRFVNASPGLSGLNFDEGSDSNFADSTEDAEEVFARAVGRRDDDACTHKLPNLSTHPPCQNEIRAPWREIYLRGHKPIPAGGAALRISPAAVQIPRPIAVQGEPGEPGDVPSMNSPQIFDQLRVASPESYFGDDD